MTTAVLKPIECRPLQWFSFYELDTHSRQVQYRYRDDKAKHQLYAWDDTAQCYIFRDDTDSPYIVATGQQLSDADIRGFSAAHLWVIKPGDVSRVQYAKLYQIVLTGDAPDEIQQIIEQRQSGQLKYDAMVQALVDVEASKDDLIRVRDAFGYKAGWEYHVLRRISA